METVREIVDAVQTYEVEIIESGRKVRVWCAKGAFEVRDNVIVGREKEELGALIVKA